MMQVESLLFREPMMVAICRRVSRRLAVLGLLLAACTLLCRPAWAVGYSLTHEELGRLLKVVDKRGTRVAIPRAVASVLQLKSGQHTPDIKEAAYLDEDGNRHGFGPLNDGSGFFMFSTGASLGHVVYVVDSNLHLVHAARSLLKNGPLIMLPDAEAQRELEEEFRRWSKVLSPSGPVVAPRPFPFKEPQETKSPAIEPQPFPFKQPEATNPPKEPATTKP